jgi:hypothetical protein
MLNPPHFLALLILALCLGCSATDYKNLRSPGTPAPKDQSNQSPDPDKDLGQNESPDPDSKNPNSVDDPDGTGSPDPSSGPDSDIPPIQDLLPSELTIGAFNIRRMGEDGQAKDWDRLAKLIVSGEFDVFGAQEVMTKTAAEELLLNLNEEQAELDEGRWHMILSPVASGEWRYKEFFAFYYRGETIAPSKTSEFCGTTYAWVGTSSACFVKDLREGDQPDFEREPFVGYFEHGNRKIIIVNVHVFYGSREAEDIARRHREMGKINELLERLRGMHPKANIFAVGDFNLELDSGTSYSVESEFFTLESGERVIGLISEGTTVGGSNYDHVFYLDGNPMSYSAGSAKVFDDLYSWSYSAIDDYSESISDHFPIHARFIH